MSVEVEDLQLEYEMGKSKPVIGIPIYNLKVRIEKTKLAKQLEQKLDISWDLVQHFTDDAGFDLRACIGIPTTLPPSWCSVIPSGLHFEMEPGWEIQIRPRSGLAAKHGITITNSPGTVDYGYREEVKIIIQNLGREPFHISPGDRIAQACFRRVPNVKFEYVDEIEKTIRQGFGSSGVA